MGQKINAKEVATDREIFGAPDLESTLNEIKGKKFMDYVNVKDFGAKGDGVTDDSLAFLNAFEFIENNDNKNTLFIPKSNYSLENFLEYTFTSDIYIISDNAKLIDNTEIVNNDIGILNLNGNENNICFINGINLFSNKNMVGVGNRTGIRITKFNNIQIKDNIINGFNYSGILVDQIKNFGLIKNNNITNCNYSGINIINSIDINVKDNYIKNIGYDIPNYGYGITAATSVINNNENINISQNKIFNCLRKGIDVHNGVNVIINGNTIKGFGYTGVHAVHESSSKYVKNVKIINNYIEQTTEINLDHVAYGIIVGNTLEKIDDYFLIDNNTIYNIKISNNVYANPIYIQLSDTGSPKNVIITNNNLIDNKKPNGSIIKTNNYSSQIDYVNISNNVIKESYSDGVIIYLRQILDGIAQGNIIKIKAGIPSIYIYFQNNGIIKNNIINTVNTASSRAFDALIKKDNIENGVVI